jgi:hypothetical protein
VARLALPGIDEARDVAREVLTDLPRRLKHSLAVGDTSAVVAEQAKCRPQTAQLATIAAYLHDLGYASPLHQTRFHPIDGARYLERLGWDALVPFVAHHSQAWLQAQVLELDLELHEFRKLRGIVQDVVDYSDVRTGPDGQRMTPEERLDEIVRRHGGDSSALVVPRRRPFVDRLVRRIERRCGGDPLG